MFTHISSLISGRFSQPYYLLSIVVRLPLWIIYASSGRHRIWAGHHSSQVLKVNSLTLVSMVLAIILLITQSVPTNATANVHSASSVADDSYETCTFGLEYLGAFRLPSGTFGASSVNFGGAAIALNPANQNHSFFMVGEPQHQCIGEFSIPALVNSSNISDLNTAEVLQNFRPVLPYVQQNNPNPNFPVDRIAGMLVVGNKLVLAGHNFYDVGNPPCPVSHITLSSLNLASAQVTGICQVGQQGGGFVGGYMCAVPPEWQKDLGAPYLTGQGPLNIVSRSSHGAGIFGFNPNLLGLQAVTPAIPYVFYTGEHLPPGSGYGSTSPLFNGSMNVSGIVLPPGPRKTRSGKTRGANKVTRVEFVATFGDTGYGTHGVWYGPGDANNPPDTARPEQGPHHPPYTYLALFYNVKDLVKVRRGEIAAWDVVPTSLYFTFPYTVASCRLGGVAYDSNTRRLYVVQKFADMLEEFWFKPVVHCYQLNFLMKEIAKPNTETIGPGSPKESARPGKQVARPHKEVISPQKEVSRSIRGTVRPDKGIARTDKEVLVGTGKPTYPTIPASRITRPDNGERGSTLDKVILPTREESHPDKSYQGVKNYCWTKSPTGK